MADHADDQALFELLATRANLCGPPGERRRALSQLRPLLSRVDHFQRAQCLTKRPIHAHVDEASGEVILPFGDYVLKPALLGTGKPYGMAESAAGVLSMLVEDEFAEVRLEAIAAIADLARCDPSLLQRCAELLVDVLTDDSDAVRARALQLLRGLLGAAQLSPDHVRALLGALGDKSAAVREACIHAVASIRLHAGLGFEHVGVEREVGRKFGRWLDIVIMQLLL
jgi:hypothetical protein